MKRSSLIFLLPVLVFLMGCEKKTLSGRYVSSVDPDARPYLEFDETHVLVCSAVLKIPLPYRIRGNTLKAGPGGFHNDRMLYMVIEDDGSLDFDGTKFWKVPKAQSDPVQAGKGG